MHHDEVRDIIESYAPPDYWTFVGEYVKDFNARRAARVSGLDPDQSYSIRDSPLVAEAIQRVVEHKLASKDIDQRWVLMFAVDNAIIARQSGNISASNTALTIVAKHSAVDAFAAEKHEISDSAALVTRLQRARARMTKVSFL